MTKIEHRRFNKVKNAAWDQDVSKITVLRSLHRIKFIGENASIQGKIRNHHEADKKHDCMRALCGKPT